MRGQLRQQDVVLAPKRDQTARAMREARRTGFLSLPARQLTEFPVQAYHLEEHMDKDEKKWECVDLVKLDLSHNAISSLSEEISALRTVTSIKLCKNALQTLPDGFFELEALTYLDLSHNQLDSDLSERFGALMNLKELALSGNKLRRLPDSICDLADLEALRVEENALVALPEQIGRLHKLRVLTAHTNHLTALPPSFDSLRNLQNLDLKKNRLESTADALCTLAALTFLDLRQNRLSVFPLLPQSAVLDQLFLGFNALSSVDDVSLLRLQTGLTVLDMRDNKLASLPSRLVCLPRLKTLDVANNDLSDLPPALGYLKHLHHLVVDGNPLRSIRRSVLSSGCETLKKYLRTRGGPPEGVVDALEEERDELQAQRERESQASLLSSASLVALFRDAAAARTLDLTASKLTTLPDELEGAGRFAFGSTLLHLTLSKNRLRVLPAAVGQLVALQSLTVEDNALETLHASIATLPRLQVLRLRKNQLTTASVDVFLSESLALGSVLQELDLRGNRLTHLPPHLARLDALETLLLAFNRLETLADFPWSQLEHLSVVSVSDNKLRSLGRIYEAPRLTSLAFENNNLSQVPCELGLSPHLRAVYMNGNPQRTVRGGVLAKGSAEILTYLRNKLPPDAVLSPSSPVAAPPSHSCLSRPESAVKAGEMTAKSDVDCMYAAHGVTALDQQQEAAIASVDPRLRPPTSTMDQDVLEQVTKLEGAIQELETQLENPSLSGAKRFALKKQLAMARATKIRETRKLQ